MRMPEVKHVILVCVWVAVAIVATSQDGVSEEDTITIGISAPLTGPYGDQGLDQKRGYELAVERINAQGGLLGNEIDYVLKDSELAPDVAKQNAREFIEQDQVDMVTGGSSSATAIAKSDICREQEVLFMAAQAHSSELTGFDRTEKGFTTQVANRYTFRWFFNDWMTKEALIPFIVEEFGEDSKYFNITSDYAWGWSMDRAVRQGTGLHAAGVLDTVWTDLGQQDYSQELQQAEESGADVLALNLYGQDFVRAMEQVEERGLWNDMQIVTPLIDLYMAYEVSNEALQRTYSTSVWYHGLQESYEGSREFVELFKEEYGRPPGTSAASAWVAIKEWAAAVERARTTEPDEVISELEGHEFNLLKEGEKWRSWDHQAVTSIYVVRGTSPAEMEDEWDVLEVVESFPGRDVLRSREENPVMFEPLD